MGWRPRGSGKGRSASLEPRAQARGRGARGRPRRGARDAAEMKGEKRFKRITMRIVLDGPDMKDPYLIWPDGTTVWGRNALNRDLAHVPERILKSRWLVDDNGSEDWDDGRDGDPATARCPREESAKTQKGPVRLKPNKSSKDVSLSDSSTPEQKIQHARTEKKCSIGRRGGKRQRKEPRRDNAEAPAKKKRK